jgi:hypothetical protein
MSISPARSHQQAVWAMPPGGGERKGLMLMETLYQESETGCCQRFDPEPWDEKEISLQDELFVKARTRAFLHIPVGFGKVMKEYMERIKDADALAEKPLMLCDEKSLFHTDVYVAVSKEVPGAEMVRISGTFLSKVFEGPYKDAGKWVKQMKKYVESKGKEMKKLYSYYTTCPACAKAYGKCYTVLLAKV